MLDTEPLGLDDILATWRPAVSFEWTKSEIDVTEYIHEQLQNGLTSLQIIATSMYSNRLFFAAKEMGGDLIPKLSVSVCYSPEVKNSFLPETLTSKNWLLTDSWETRKDEFYFSCSNIKLTQNELYTPWIFISTEGYYLQFQHQISNIAEEFGGVLELRTNEFDWKDVSILIREGEYFGRFWDNRVGWTGVSSATITTTIPSLDKFIGRAIQLRFVARVNNLLPEQVAEWKIFNFQIGKRSKRVLSVCGDGVLGALEECDSTMGCSPTCTCISPLFESSSFGCAVSSGVTTATITSSTYSTFNFSRGVASGVYVIAYGGGGGSILGINGGAGGSAFGYINTSIRVRGIQVGAPGTNTSGGIGATNGGLGGTSTSNAAFVGTGGGGSTGVWMFGVTNPILLAGGGGGAGGGYFINLGGAGGAGGGAFGERGSNSTENRIGGGGATQFAGGLACSLLGCGQNGTGPFGNGGNGGGGSESGGGGGGGGYFGGAGGQYDAPGGSGGAGGGGGGSGFVNSAYIVNGFLKGGVGSVPYTDVGTPAGFPTTSGMVFLVYRPLCNFSCVNGICSGSNTCTCQSGWTGANCSTPVCAAGCVLGTCIAPNTCQCSSNLVSGVACNNTCGDGVVTAPEECDNSIGCNSTCKCISPFFVANNSLCSLTVDTQMRLVTQSSTFNLTRAGAIIASGVYVVSYGGGGASSRSVSGGSGGAAFGFINSTVVTPLLDIVVGQAANGRTGGTGFANGGSGGQSGVSPFNVGGGGGGATAIRITFPTRVAVIAGGGGGAGGGATDGVGGAGGSGGGVWGDSGFNSADGRFGGTGGSQTAAGSGSGSTCNAGACSGSGGVGGNGAGSPTDTNIESGGGGGGGGYFGGGGGEADAPVGYGGAGGGAGGSGFINSSIVSNGFLRNGNRSVAYTEFSTTYGSAGRNGSVWIIFRSICPQGCINGVCVSANNCTCSAGWTGSNCATAICTQGCVYGTCIAPNVCQCNPTVSGTNCTTAVCGDGVVAGGEECEATIGCSNSTCKCILPLFTPSSGSCKIASNAIVTTISNTFANVTFNLTRAGVNSTFGIYVVAYGAGGGSIQGVRGGAGGASFGLINTSVSTLQLVIGRTANFSAGGVGAVYGGNGGNTVNSSWVGAGGGAATGVYITGTSNPIILAGGGGGAGGGSRLGVGGAGGAGGGSIGENGGNSTSGRIGGGGATQFAGGVACLTVECGTDGTGPFGNGGNGGGGSHSGGGGGGGGYFGGAGGQYDTITGVGGGGGGGGSGFVNSSVVVSGFTKTASGSSSYPEMNTTFGSAATGGAVFLIYLSRCSQGCLNGVCTGGTCSCDAGWSGTDCSIPICTPACVYGTCVAPNTCFCNPYVSGASCNVTVCGDGFVSGGEECESTMGCNTTSCKCIPGLFYANNSRCSIAYNNSVFALRISFTGSATTFDFSRVGAQTSFGVYAIAYGGGGATVKLVPGGAGGASFGYFTPDVLNVTFLRGYPGGGARNNIRGLGFANGGSGGNAVNLGGGGGASSVVFVPFLATPVLVAGGGGGAGGSPAFYFAGAGGQGGGTVGLAGGTVPSAFVAARLGGGGGTQVSQGTNCVFTGCGSAGGATSTVAGGLGGNGGGVGNGTSASGGGGGGGGYFGGAGGQHDSFATGVGGAGGGGGGSGYFHPQFVSFGILRSGTSGIPYSEMSSTIGSTGNNGAVWFIYRSFCPQGCFNGVCSNVTLNCTCDSGWTGISCSVPVCSQGCVFGTCVSPDTCNCNDGYTGSNCLSTICGDGLALGAEECDSTVGCDSNCNCLEMFQSINGTCKPKPGTFAQQFSYNGSSVTINMTTQRVVSGVFVVAVGGGGGLLPDNNIPSGAGGTSYGLIATGSVISQITVFVGGGGVGRVGGIGASNGGNGGSGYSERLDGAGGGGSSAVWIPDSPNPVLLAPGGGGVGGGWSEDFNLGLGGTGGAGGGNVGQDGGSSDATGGYGGTQIEGGLGGCPLCEFTGGQGPFGNGGEGAVDYVGGGGGGAGFYGGGGGGADPFLTGGGGGGGGGSGFIDTNFIFYGSLRGGFDGNTYNEIPSPIGKPGNNGAIWVYFRSACNPACVNGYCGSTNTCVCNTGYSGSACTVVCGDGVVTETEECDSTIGCNTATCKCISPIFQANNGSCIPSSSTIVQRIDYTGNSSEVNFLQSGIASGLYFVAYGAGGGYAQGIAGGAGGAAFGYLNTTTIARLQVYAGGAGSQPVGGRGVTNGGNGGTGSLGSLFSGGGGGGSSGVWIPGVSSPIIVAGGGGGAAAALFSFGGAGGGVIGESGSFYPNKSRVGGLAGSAACNATNCFTSNGTGGNGTSATYGGGGGGAGYFGGLGGPSDSSGVGGGGGGSGFINSSLIRGTLRSGSGNLPYSEMSSTIGAAGMDGAVWVIYSPLCNQKCVNGNCTGTNTCTCNAGYTDPTCSTPICPQGCLYGKCIRPNTCQCNNAYITGASCNVTTCGDGFAIAYEECDSSIGCGSNCKCITPFFNATNYGNCTLGSVTTSSTITYTGSSSLVDLVTLGVSLNVGVYIVAYGAGGASVQGVSGGAGGVGFGFLNTSLLNITQLVVFVGGKGVNNTGGLGISNGGNGGSSSSDPRYIGAGGGGATGVSLIGISNPILIAAGGGGAGGGNTSNVGGPGGAGGGTQGEAGYSGKDQPGGFGASQVSAGNGGGILSGSCSGADLSGCGQNGTGPFGNGGNGGGGSESGGGGGGGGYFGGGGGRRDTAGGSGGAGGGGGGSSWVNSTLVNGNVKGGVKQNPYQEMTFNGGAGGSDGVIYFIYIPVPPVTTGQVTSARLTTSFLTTAPITTSPLTTSPLTTSPLTTSPLTTSQLTTSPLTTSQLTTSQLTTLSLTTSPLSTSQITSAQSTTSPLTTLIVTAGGLTTSPLTTLEATSAALAPVTTQGLTTTELTTSIISTSPLTTIASPITSSELTTAQLPLTAATTDTLSPDVTSFGFTTSPSTSSQATFEELTSSSITSAISLQTSSEISIVDLTTNELTTSLLTTQLLSTNSITSEELTTHQLTTNEVTLDPFTTGRVTEIIATTAALDSTGTAQASSKSKNSNIVAIAVGSVAGVILVIVIVTAVMIMRARRVKAQKKNFRSDSESSSVEMSAK